MNFLWKPSTKLAEESKLNEFTKYIGKDFNYDFKKLWEWSVRNPEIFWSKFWDFSKIVGDKGNEVIRKDKIFNKTKFFPDSKINYSENLIKKRTKEIAINFLSEKGFEEKICWEDLYEKVCRFSAYLKKIDLKKATELQLMFQIKLSLLFVFSHALKMDSFGLRVHLILVFKEWLIALNKLNQRS